MTDNSTIEQPEISLPDKSAFRHEPNSESPNKSEESEEIQEPTDRELPNTTDPSIDPVVEDESSNTLRNEQKPDSEDDPDLLPELFPTDDSDKTPPHLESSVEEVPSERGETQSNPFLSDPPETLFEQSESSTESQAERDSKTVTDKATDSQSDLLQDGGDCEHENKVKTEHDGESEAGGLPTDNPFLNEYPDGENQSQSPSNDNVSSDTTDFTPHAESENETVVSPEPGGTDESNSTQDSDRGPDPSKDRQSSEEITEPSFPETDAGLHEPTQKTPQHDAETQPHELGHTLQNQKTLAEDISQEFSRQLHSANPGPKYNSFYDLLTSILALPIVLVVIVLVIVQLIAARAWVLWFAIGGFVLADIWWAGNEAYWVESVQWVEAGSSAAVELSVFYSALFFGIPMLAIYLESLMDNS